MTTEGLDFTIDRSCCVVVVVAVIITARRNYRGKQRCESHRWAERSDKRQARAVYVVPFERFHALRVPTPLAASYFYVVQYVHVSRHRDVSAASRRTLTRPIPLATLSIWIVVSRCKPSPYTDTELPDSVSLNCACIHFDGKIIKRLRDGSKFAIPLLISRFVSSRDSTRLLCRFRNKECYVTRLCIHEIIRWNNRSRAYICTIHSDATLMTIFWSLHRFSRLPYRVPISYSVIVRCISLQRFTLMQTPIDASPNFSLRKIQK